MSKVITFYSVRGGTGRTLAAANVGVSLAREGNKVLLVDFDLEAPGITHIPSFAPPRDSRTAGLVEYIADSVTARHGQDLSPYFHYLEGFGGHLAVMPVGRRGTPSFQESFDCSQEFLSGEAFDNTRGAPGLLLFLDLSRGWTAYGFDYVIIDSRAGLTNIGGICTRLLPDVIFTLFRFGNHGLNDTERVLRYIGDETLYGDPIQVKLVATMVPVMTEDKHAKEIDVVKEVLGREPDIELPFHEPFLLTEDIYHITDPSSPLARGYRKLQDAIRSTIPRS